MPKIYIDGLEFEYSEYVQKYEKERGKKPTLLQFALDHGVEIPYFCYHPSMSVPTNCRMCLCEVGSYVRDKETAQLVLEADGKPKINWGRKPATSCNQDLYPDMVVRTNRTSKVTEKAQKGVLEFILINHPLDCPICDQAGECPLQINTYKYGPEGSRFELTKVHKPKRIILGPRVTLDAERCINCTRCVRFTEEISHTNQLSIVARGDKNFPTAGPGKSFDDPYSMNVIDICPVGALTSADFRFQARVWEMSYAPSVCTGCSRVCSVNVWVRDNKVMRLTPRENLAVNQYWMCDEGRLDYAKFGEKRVSGMKAHNDIPVGFEDGLSAIATLLTQSKGKIVFVGSPHASLEDNYMLKKFAAELGSSEVYYTEHLEKGWGDNFLRKDDRAPNAASCKLLGFKLLAEAELTHKMQGAELVFVMNDAKACQQAAAHAKAVVAMASNYFEGWEKARYVIPAATAIEANCTFINCDNLPQFAMQAKRIARMSPEMWMTIGQSRLDAGAAYTMDGQPYDNWRQADHTTDCLPAWMSLSRMAQILKLSTHFLTHKEIFSRLQSEFPLIAKYKFPSRKRKEAFKTNQLEFAIN